jgi:hypothetical protein
MRVTCLFPYTSITCPINVHNTDFITPYESVKKMAQPWRKYMGDDVIWLIYTQIDFLMFQMTVRCICWLNQKLRSFEWNSVVLRCDCLNYRVRRQRIDTERPIRSPMWYKMLPFVYEPPELPSSLYPVSAIKWYTSKWLRLWELPPFINSVSVSSYSPTLLQTYCISLPNSEHQPSPCPTLLCPYKFADTLRSGDRSRRPFVQSTCWVGLWKREAARHSENAFKMWAIFVTTFRK